MGSREQALIREFPNGETHLRSLLFRRDGWSEASLGSRLKLGEGEASAEGLSPLRGGAASDLWTSRDQQKVFIP